MKEEKKYPEKEINKIEASEQSDRVQNYGYRELRTSTT